MKKQNLSSEDNITKDSSGSTKTTATIYISSTLVHHLDARGRSENLTYTDIINTLISLFVKSNISFYDFKSLITKTFNIKYDDSLFKDENPDDKSTRRTLTLNLDKNNHNAVKKYVEENKNKELGISVSSIVVQLISLLALSNTFFHDFCIKITDSINKKEKK